MISVIGDTIAGLLTGSAYIQSGSAGRNIEVFQYDWDTETKIYEQLNKLGVCVAIGFPDYDRQTKTFSDINEQVYKGIIDVYEVVPLNRSNGSYQSAYDVAENVEGIINNYPMTAINLWKINVISNKDVSPERLLTGKPNNILVKCAVTFEIKGLVTNR